MAKPAQRTKGGSVLVFDLSQSTEYLALLGRARMRTKAFALQPGGY